jgi:DNA-3-methyladenine glycosylase
MKLAPSFFDRPTLDLAQDLLGCVLVRSKGRARLAGRIVESEAYVGAEDLACHASKGRTARTEVMFGPPGHAYVYLIYGMYCCLNVVTGPRDYPAAVLVRAIEPVEGVAHMRRNRGRDLADDEIASGPGKLCQALAIDRRLNGIRLDGDDLWLEDPGTRPGSIVATPRIGVDYAGEYRDKPWRFFIEGSPHVSRHRLNREGNPAGRERIRSVNGPFFA